MDRVNFSGLSSISPVLVQVRLATRLLDLLIIWVATFSHQRVPMELLNRSADSRVIRVRLVAYPITYQEVQRGYHTLQRVQDSIRYGATLWIFSIIAIQLICRLRG